MKETCTVKKATNFTNKFYQYLSLQAQVTRPNIAGGGGGDSSQVTGWLTNKMVNNRKEDNRTGSDRLQAGQARKGEQIRKEGPQAEEARKNRLYKLARRGCWRNK
jgi:hypothetical protein